MVPKILLIIIAQIHNCAVGKVPTSINTKLEQCIYVIENCPRYRNTLNV